jgi:formate dehydrogenase major subunit
MIQLLLGDIGRPGGGILALRGHASIQGSTDIPTLYELLPGYIPMPEEGMTDLAKFLDKTTAKGGFWGHMDAYMISLLKAWYGDHATAENEWCFGHLPRVNGDHSIYPAIMGMFEGKVKGFFCVGENPAVGSANASLHRRAMANLDWLVVRDFFEIESAAFWYDSPEIETGKLRTADIKTEIFMLPAADHLQKDGSFTNTQRLLQWHHKAVEPKDDARSELWFYYHLGKRIREKLRASTDPKDRAINELTWEYPELGTLAEPDAQAVLREINGWGPDGKALDTYTKLEADGSTVSGCWIYCGVFKDEQNQAARRKPGHEQSSGRTGLGLGLAGEPAATVQPRVGRSRRQSVERTQALRVVGRREERVDRTRRPRLRQGQTAGLRPTRRREGGEGARRAFAVHHAG